MTQKKKMALHGEYDIRLADMKAEAAATAASMQAHIEADSRAFASLIAQLTEVNLDLKSLLKSQAFAAGVWKMVTIILGSGLIVSFLALMWRVFR
jgi:hypothetical protein